MNDPRLDVLFAAYFDGALSEDDRAELERVLLSSPGGREAYWRYARLHAQITQWGQEEWGRRMAMGAQGEEAPGDVVGKRASLLNPIRLPSPFRSRLPWLVAAAASIALVSTVLLAIIINGRSVVTPDIASSPPATSPTGIAVLTSSVDARWEGTAFPPGSVLEAGTLLKLAAGAAHVELYSGARLVLQGPVELVVRSEMEAYCRAGRMSAFVPAPARGFRVSSDRLSIVDLGTEFGLDVPGSGVPEVHVFRGEVQALPTGGAATGPVRLTSGEAGKVVHGTLERMAAVPQSFLRESEYGRLADSDTRRRQAIWQASVSSISGDASTLAHFTFPAEQFRERTIPNLSRGVGSSASIVGCVPADGRWPLTRAVEFRGPGDRIRLEVGGAYNAITLMTWVRFDTLPNTYHALVAPDGLADGTLRWGLTGHGELRLGIARRSGQPEPNWEVIMTGAVMTADRVGRWVQLVSTFDGKMMRHYVDGALVKAGDAYTPVPVVIGPAEVGNWRGPTPRFFRGRMDELAILSRALSAEEVKVLYEQGRPLDAISP